MDSKSQGLGSGLLGVIIFSGSLPATRLAVSGFSPLFLSGARAVLAALLGLLMLLLLRQRRPQAADWPTLAVVALGVVLGFPLLSALALREISAAHATVFIALLPLATAAFAVLRGAARPRPRFWLYSVLGAATVAGFALLRDHSTSLRGDLLMLAAIVVCGLGYAEGARLTPRLGGWQVICWALLLASPLMLLLALLNWPQHGSVIRLPAWLGLIYVSLFSMLIGFVFWYRGLALGGVARISQLQLLQPFLALALAALLLGETIAPALLASCAAVLLCVVLAQRHA